jgi:hypothetical protein
MMVSYLIWHVSTALLFHYIVNVLHPDEAFGEPIWVIDPLGFLLISAPLAIAFFVGFLAVFGSFMPDTDRSP